MPPFLTRSLSALGSATLLALASCSNSTSPSSSAATGTRPASTMPGAQADQSFPEAHKTDKPGQVISPYPPHNLIDVTRNPKTGQPFRSGEFAVDPSEPNNPRIFRIP